MIVNELKNILPLGWEKEFKHRKDWDPEGYSVAAFKLNNDIKELVLAKNDSTDDIMEYFFDDMLNDYQAYLERAIKFLSKKDNISCDYRLNKDYIIFGGNFGYSGRELVLNIENKQKDNFYPRVKLAGITIRVHRLIAFIFVPNPYPEKYNIVNHKDCDRSNFKKENLEWCDAKWNAQKENQSVPKQETYHLRLSDNRLFSRQEVAKEYNIKPTSVTSLIICIQKNRPYHGSMWEAIHPTLQNYLSKHPLRDDWYPHPIISSIVANGCGVLKINGKLRVGSLHNQGTSFYYIISLNDKKYKVHRLLSECYIGRELLNEEVVDHIIPVSKDDINNSIENLKVCSSQKENMQNKNTISKLGSKVSLYNIYGKYIGTYNSLRECSDSVSLGWSASPKEQLTIKDNYIMIDSSLTIESRLDYIFYKWKIDKSGNKILIDASQYLYKLSDTKSTEFSGNIVQRLRKYLNTGMPAPDGYYYQQGTPNKMIYDPTNTKRIKKRPEIKWKDRK